MQRSLLALLLLPTLCVANDNNADVPAELQRFVEADTTLLAYAGADLNGDGLSDYVFILERQKNDAAASDIETGQRPLKNCATAKRQQPENRQDQPQNRLLFQLRRRIRRPVRRTVGYSEIV